MIIVKLIINESIMITLSSNIRLYTNNAIPPNIEPNDTYFVNNKVKTNTTKPKKTPRGVKNKKTPVAVATALPPLNLANTENMCPNIASKPHAMGLTVELSSSGSKQASAPFNISAIATINPAFMPKTL